MAAAVFVWNEIPSPQDQMTELRNFTHNIALSFNILLADQTQNFHQKKKKIS